MQKWTSTLDYIMGLIAAAIHDVGHPGTNNAFHVQSMSAWGVRYNDQSVLENMHVALSFELLKNDPHSNWFEMLPGRESDVGNMQQYVRRGLIAMVLATDMAKHAFHSSELAHVVTEGDTDGTLTASDSAGEKQHQLDRKLFLMGSMLHAADVSNPCKPQPLMLQWAKRVLEECWAQGDQEIREGLPCSPLCDRASGVVSVPKSQIGFITYVIQPYWSSIAALVGGSQALDTLSYNTLYWEEKAKEDATFEACFPA